MASPNTLALRARMDALSPTEIHVDTPQVGEREAVPGEYAASIKEACRLRNLRLGTAKVQRDRDHAAALNAAGKPVIPTSGPGRRRAKARRNAQAIDTPASGEATG